MLTGLFIAYLGSSLLLARMSAEAAKVRYDSSLLWTNKLDRYEARPLRRSDFCPSLSIASLCALHVRQNHYIPDMLLLGLALLTS